MNSIVERYKLLTFFAEKCRDLKLGEHLLFNDPYGNVGSQNRPTACIEAIREMLDEKDYLIDVRTGNEGPVLYVRRILRERPPGTHPSILFADKMVALKIPPPLPPRA